MIVLAVTEVLPVLLIEGLARVVSRDSGDFPKLTGFAVFFRRQTVIPGNSDPSSADFLYISDRLTLALHWR